MIPGPRGYVVCDCVRKPASRALITRILDLGLEDFATWDDERRRRQGLPPYKEQEGTHDDT